MGFPVDVLFDFQHMYISRRVSEYDPAYQTPHFSNASPMHLRSSSVYSDALHIRLHMLCNSALPPASAPPHVPLLVCLFVCFPFQIVSIN